MPTKPAQIKLSDDQARALREAIDKAGIPYVDLMRRFGLKRWELTNRLRSDGRRPWPADQFAELGPLLGRPPLWPVYDISRLDTPRAPDDRVARYFREHDAPYSVVQAVRALASSPDRWPDAAVEALVRAVESPPIPTPVPSSRRRRPDGRPSAGSSP